MFRVIREASTLRHWGRRFKESGKSVSAYVRPPHQSDTTGEVVLVFARRLIPETFGNERTVPQLATTVHEGRRLVTYIGLSPGSAILLRDALNDVIEKAGIIDESEEKVS